MAMATPRRQNPSDPAQVQPPISSTAGQATSSGGPGSQAGPVERLSGVYVANTTFATELDGVPTLIHQGQTHVREGHQLLAQAPNYFDPVEVNITFDVETATANPGEKRGAR